MSQTSETPDAVAPPPGNPRYALLDALRGIAAMMIIVYHAAQMTTGLEDYPVRAISHLDASVTLFFVLSGFLLYRPFAAARAGIAPKVEIRPYFRRRLLRIVPGYWVALLVMAPLLTFASPWGLPNILFGQIYTPDGSRSGIPPAWTICVELSFYVLLPVFVWFVARARLTLRRELLVLAGLVLMGVVVRALVTQLGLSKRAVDPLPGTAGWFALGMGTALMSVHGGAAWDRFRRFAARRPHALLAVAAVPIVVSTLATAGSGIEGSPTSPLASVAMFLGYCLFAWLVVVAGLYAAPETRVARVLGHGVMTWLGLVSYGIYLYHFPLMAQLGTESFYLRAVLGLVMAIAAGAASYYLVERHALRLKRPRSSRGARRGVPDPAAGPAAASALAGRAADARAER